MAKPSIGSYYSHYFKMPSIRRSDLADIEKVILEEVRPEQYHVACQGFVYDRVDDIPLHSGIAQTLVVYTHTPCLRLKFARSWAELYCEDSNPENNPAIRRVSELVSRRERSILWRSCRYAIWLAPSLGYSVLCEVIILISSNNLPHEFIKPAVGFLFLTAAWWAFSYRAALFRFSRIDLEH